MAGQARIQHGVDGGVSGKELRHRGRVLAVPLHPQHQRLEAPQREVGVERTGDRPGAVLQEREGGVELLVVGDQRATDHIGVAADVLRGGVQHHVSAQRQRLLQRRMRRTYCPPTPLRPTPGRLRQCFRCR